MIIKIISLLISVFLPDLYLGEITKKLREPLEITTEKKDWKHLPLVIGRIERFICCLFLICFPEDYTSLLAFISFWVALQTYGGKENWEKIEDDEYRQHRGRANFLVFLIGKSLSFLSTIFIYYLSLAIIQKCFCCSCSF